MTNDTRTSDEIERDIADERAQMSDTFNDLQKKFSVDSIVNDIGDMVRDQSGEFGRTISKTVGRNPAAVVLVGVGLAWLFLGKDRTQPAGVPAWYGDVHASLDRRSHRQDAVRDGQNAGDDDASGGMISRVRTGAGNLGHAVSDAADNWGQSASALTARLSEGLEGLSDEAKSRVVTARRAAHEARLSSEAVMTNGVRRATDFFEDQPLVVGALAVAVGAAIGAVLPHSKIEDDAMGESSDRLFAEAQSVFREERDKAMAAAKRAGKTVASEVKSDVEDIGSALGGLLPDGKSASDVVVDHASNAAGRVLDRTTGKSGQKDLSPSDT